MIDILFILPDGDGLETPFGEVFKFSCSENDPVGLLFEVIRKRLGILDVRLSLEAPNGGTIALMAIDPHDPATVGSLVTTGARIIVGYRKEQ
jgi:hypothetical protein